MPTMADNYLTVTPRVPGDIARDQYEEFRRRLFAGVERGREACLHLFDTFVPMPKKYEYADNLHPADDGKTRRDWEMEHWGLKWGDGIGRVQVDKRRHQLLVLYFRTPWGAPDKGVVEISRQFPLVEFLDYWLNDETPSRGRLLAIGGSILTQEETNPWSGTFLPSGPSLGSESGAPDGPRLGWN